MASLPSRFSFFDPIRWWGRLASARVALVDRARDDRYTYAELDRLADAWQDRLASLGVGRGDRVGTLAGNRAAQVALLYACWRSGAALVPLNWRLTATELSRIVANARPKVIVGEDRFQSLAEAAGVTSSGALWEGLDVVSEAPRRRDSTRGVSTLVTPDADDAALILYTSGSTGAPKGAVLPHRQVFYNAVATATGWELGPNDIAPISPPFFHTGGWNVFATPLWQLGGRIVLFDHFDPASYLHGLSEERCTVALTVPTQIIMMLESSAWGQRLPSLRFFISGGAPCPLSIMERVRSSGFAMKEGFGLTECGPNCFTMPTEEVARRPGSVGWPMPFLDMRLVRDDGHDVLPNEVGELLLRGPQMGASRAAMLCCHR